MNILKMNYAEILNSDFDLKSALTQTALKGYAFSPDALTAEACKALEEEAAQLQFEAGNYVTKPIKEYKSTRVTQAHERAYFHIGDRKVPVATAISRALTHYIIQLASTENLLKDLQLWAPTEAGYQRYRTDSHHISPHRDRRTDQLLGVTATVNGSAPVRAYRPLGASNDYSQLELVEEFETASRALMFLRAPGFSNSEQVIHEVLPPTEGERLVLNLRMRHDVLKAPGEEV